MKIWLRNTRIIFTLYIIHHTFLMFTGVRYSKVRISVLENSFFNLVEWHFQIEGIIYDSYMCRYI